MSTTPKTTAPEEWHYLPADEHRDCFRIFAGNRYIASVGNSDETPEEREANARMISAAPKMHALTQRIANLNPAAFELVPGMLAQLVDEACAIMAKVNP